LRSSTLVPVTAVSGTDGTAIEAPVYRALPVTHLKLLILQFFGFVTVEPSVVLPPKHKKLTALAVVNSERSPQVADACELTRVPSK
jgi:hypothetical protein